MRSVSKNMVEFPTVLVFVLQYRLLKRLYTQHYWILWILRICDTTSIETFLIIFCWTGHVVPISWNTVLDLSAVSASDIKMCWKQIWRRVAWLQRTSRSFQPIDLHVLKCAKIVCTHLSLNMCVPFRTNVCNVRLIWDKIRCVDSSVHHHWILITNGLFRRCWFIFDKINSDDRFILIGSF